MTNPTADDSAKIDKALIAEDNASKTDLSQGTDAPLDDGSSQVPISADPFEARKTLFKKQRDVRGHRIAQDAAAHADVEDALRVLAEEAGQGSSRNELDRGSHMDTNRPDRAPERAPSRPDPVESTDGVNAVVGGDDRVKVKVLGQEFEVPQSDVDAAGGLSAYQKDRAASIRLQRVAQEEARLKAEQEEFNRQRANAGRNAPAKAGGDTPSAAPIQADGAGAGVDVEARSEAIVADLYSGDTKRAKAAIAQVLAAQTRPAAQLDPTEVARQAADLLKQQDRAAPPVNPQAAARNAEYDELNAMMAEKYADVLADPKLKQAAVEKFEALRADPSNAGRRLVDLGREAAQGLKANPRQAVVERKQQLPPVNRGSQGHRADAPAPKLSYFDQQRKARGLPY